MSNRKATPGIKAMIRDARLPEKSVPVCLRADLQSAFEEAERELAEAERNPSTSLAGNGARAIAERIEALRAEMRDHTIDFHLRGLPRQKWKKMLAAHPPRKTDDGGVDERDKFIGVNISTFFDAMIRVSVIAPELDEEDWRILVGDDEAEQGRLEAEGKPCEEGKLTDRQFDELSDAAWGLNRRVTDVPFSHAASRILTSDSE